MKIKAWKPKAGEDFLSKGWHKHLKTYSIYLFGYNFLIKFN